MSLRDTINKNQSAVIIIAAILILSAGAFMWVRNNPPGSGAEPVYFMDMVTKEIYAGTVEDVSPGTSPDGNQAYRVSMFTCGPCEDGQWFVMNYMRNTDTGLEISMDTTKWHTDMNPDYIKYFNEKSTCENNMSAGPCFPPQ